MASKQTSRKLIILSFGGLALLVFVVSLAVFIFGYGAKHYYGINEELQTASYLFQRGDLDQSSFYYVSAIRMGLDAGIRWLIAEPTMRTMYSLSRSGDKQGALKACRQAQNIVDGYDYAGELASECNIIQEHVDFEHWCSQDCTSHPLCQYTLACTP